MITVISGTNRPLSNSNRIARHVAQIYSDKGISSQFYSLQNLPRDIAFAEVFGNRSETFEQVVNRMVADVDKFVFVLPEYNGGFPGILKLFIDAVEPKYWHGKKAALIGIASGRAGNQRGLDHLTNILNYLRIDVMHLKPCLSQIWSDEEGVIKLSDEYKQQLSCQADLFNKF